MRLATKKSKLEVKKIQDRMGTYESQSDHKFNCIAVLRPLSIRNLSILKDILIHFFKNYTYLFAYNIRAQYIH